jgi:hypothetical protein
MDYMPALSAGKPQTLNWMTRDSFAVPERSSLGKSTMPEKNGRTMVACPGESLYTTRVPVYAA